MTVLHTRPPSLAPNPVTNSSDAIADQVFRRGVGMFAAFGNASDAIAAQVFRKTFPAWAHAGMRIAGPLTVDGAVSVGGNLTVTGRALDHLFPPRSRHRIAAVGAAVRSRLP